MPFDMPPRGLSWEVRGGWVVNRLAADLTWPRSSAAGVVGNFGVESIEFTAFQEIGTSGRYGGIGWAQWTGVRRRNFEKWCVGNDLDPRSDEASYGFCVFEFRGADSTMQRGSDFKDMAIRLRGMTSIEEATRLVHEWYERPQEVLDGNPRSFPKRLEYAKRALAGAQTLGTTTPPPAPAPPAPANDLDERIAASVEVTQELLKECGLYGGDVDRDPGPLTQRALEAWRHRRT